MMLFVFIATLVYAEKIPNFVSVLNGSNTNVEQDLSSSIFVGQPLVFETKDTIDLISMIPYFANDGYLEIHEEFYSVLNIANEIKKYPVAETRKALKKNLVSSSANVLNY